MLRRLLAAYYEESGADLGTAPLVDADAEVMALGELLHGWLAQAGVDEAHPAAAAILDQLDSLVPVPTGAEMARRWSAMGRRPAL